MTETKREKRRFRDEKRTVPASHPNPSPGPSLRGPEAGPKPAMSRSEALPALPTQFSSHAGAPRGAPPRPSPLPTAAGRGVARDSDQVLFQAICM